MTSHFVQAAVMTGGSYCHRNRLCLKYSCSFFSLLFFWLALIGNPVGIFRKKIRAVDFTGSLRVPFPKREEKWKAVTDRPKSTTVASLHLRHGATL